METTRQNKIARLIQKELSDIFQKQTSAMRGVLVSVSVCEGAEDEAPAAVSADDILKTPTNEGESK